MMFQILVLSRSMTAEKVKNHRVSQQVKQQGKKNHGQKPAAKAHHGKLGDADIHCHERVGDQIDKKVPYKPVLYHKAGHSKEKDKGDIAVNVRGVFF